MIEEEKFALIISAKFSLQCRVKATDHVMIPDFFCPVKDYDSVKTVRFGDEKWVSIIIAAVRYLLTKIFGRDVKRNE